MHRDPTPFIPGQPSWPGHLVECVWCGYESDRGEHERVREEDLHGWECANESVCRVRFDARNEA
jgi:hypothetical protein